MRFSRVGLLLTLTLAAYCRCSAQDTIRWRPKYSLRWADFQGQRDSSSIHKDYTADFIGYSWRPTKDSFSSEVVCTFDRQKSWTITTDSLLLAHEQDHFDIAELHARKLRKAFQGYQYNPQTAKADFANIYARLSTSWHEMDMLYDQETDHGRIKEMQLKWNNKITTELAELEMYKE